MPFQFVCPHCGYQTTVDDQFAGMSGPCGQCGKQVSVPFQNVPNQSGTAAGPPQKSNTAIIIFAILGALGLLVLCVVGLLAAFLIPAVSSARNAAQQSVSQNNLRQIGLALHMYHDVHNSLPPAYIPDANGQPLVSWRVLLLPYLEQASLYQQYNQNAPWDDPSNLIVLQQRPMVYLDARDINQDTTSTSYVVITDPEFLFDAANAYAFKDLTDGMTVTAMVVAVQGSGIEWTNPKDMTLDELLQQPSSNLSNCAVLLGDGSVTVLDLETMDPDEIRALFTRSGNELFDPNEF